MPQSTIPAVLLCALAAAPATADVLLVDTTIAAATSHNFAGLSPDAANDGQALSQHVFPQTLDANANLTLPDTGGNSFLSEASGAANLRTDGVDGELTILSRASFATNVSGVLSAEVELVYTFQVTDMTYYTLTGAFNTSIGGLRLTIEEQGGSVVAGTFVGDPVNETAALGPGVYEMRARLFYNLNHSPSPNPDFTFSRDYELMYDLTFSDVPTPATAGLLALAGMTATRRRRH